MKLIPLEDRVVVKPQEAESKTAGGIVLPDSAKEKPQRGKVVSVGEGKMLDDGTVRKLEVKKHNTRLILRINMNVLKQHLKMELRNIYWFHLPEPISSLEIFI